MGGSGSTPLAKTAQAIAGLTIQTSLLGSTIPVIYGRAKTSGNLLAYYDFAATAHKSSAAQGGKGGGSPAQGTTSYTYNAAVLFALGEGPHKGVVRAWREKLVFGSVSVNSSNNLAVETDGVSVSTGTLTVALASVFVAPVSVVWMGPPLTSDGRAIATGQTLVGNGVHYSNDGAGNYAFAPDFRGVASALRISYLVSSSTAVPSALPALGLNLLGGWDGQAPWSYLTSRHPDQALGYSGIAYLVAPSYDLGTDAQVGNHSFEVSTFTEYSPTIVDAAPATIVLDALTNTRYGARWPLSKLGDLAAYNAATIATGLFLSPVLDQQQAAADWLSYLLDLTNADCTWSEGKLKIVPLADQDAVGNGVAFTANTTPVFDIGDDHYIADANAAPVRPAIKSADDTYNVVPLEFLDRANGYNTAVAQAQDQADVDDRGVRTASPVQAHAICDASIARLVAQIKLQRGLAVRRTFTFRLPWTFSLLEPLDLVTLTESILGFLRVPVRITEITEATDYTFEVTAEDCPIGMASAPRYGVQQSAGFEHDYNVAPGSVLAPFFFEPPVARTTTGLEVWAAVTSNAAAWGGCRVWVSSDGLAYQEAARVAGGARYGALQAPIGASNPADVVSVVLAGKGGQMLSGSAADALNDATLLAIGTAAGCEFVDYQTAQLWGANAYNLSMLSRGRFGTAAVAHARGETVVRVDDALAKSGPLDLSMIGRTLFFKFTSFNVYGGGEQSLADVPAYSYTLTGVQAKLPPADVGLISVDFERFGVRLTWPKDADPDVVAYELRADGTFWENATPIATVGGTSYLWGVQLSGGRTVRIKAIDAFGNYSTNNSTQLVLVPIPAPTSASAAIVGPDVVLSWSAVVGAFAIDHYSVRTGATFDSGLELDQARTTSFRRKVTAGGTLVFWIAAVDAAGNTGPAVSVQVDIASPGAPAPGNASHPSQEVIDNNVLLYWTAPTGGSLPIDRYEVRRGTSFAAGNVVGSNGNSTFTAIFEQASGTYSYWIQAIDTAGNTGPATQIVATVSQPPDYVLRSSIDSSFTGTLVGMYLDAGQLCGPSFGETFDQHYATRAWSTPQDQMAAGSPLYFEPSASAGSYEETFDYGAVIGGTTITVTTSALQLAGSTLITTSLFYKANAGDAWTAATVGATSVFASNFRFVKVRLDFSAAGGDDLVAVTSMNVKLAVKLKTDSGAGYANASDSGGTLVSFGVPFIDADTPLIQPGGTVARFGMCDFVDAPYPTSFKVLLFDLSGNRVSGPFSWTARGY